MERNVEREGRDNTGRWMQVGERLGSLETEMRHMRSDVTELKAICSKLAARPSPLEWCWRHRKVLAPIALAILGALGGWAGVVPIVEALSK